MVDGRLLTVQDLVERLKVSRSTVMGLLARREIDSLTIRRARRVTESALQAFIEERAALAQPPARTAGRHDAHSEERRTTDSPEVDTGTSVRGGHGSAEPSD